ncbi:MAG: 23S rRNA (pseudouridine(1915)-N(3))-methyltransferase RlmH [Lachnospiraceae bacterium]|nr:23S rRNA (pseudouridine(1915)-N(3))-methyltransferase RlmH [Lachnospiraceae bacterium]
MNIRFICVGKIKEPYLKKGIAFYKDKLAKKANVELIEVDDEKTPDHAGQKEEAQIRKVEGERILRYIPSDSEVYALCIDGKQMTSDTLRKKMTQNGGTRDKNITFIIGGSLGLSPDVVRKADVKISFSAMTFPHQMMRMILLEQIDRVLS